MDEVVWTIMNYDTGEWKTFDTEAYALGYPEKMREEGQWSRPKRLVFTWD